MTHVPDGFNPTKPPEASWSCRVYCETLLSVGVLPLTRRIPSLILACGRYEYSISIPLRNDEDDAMTGTGPMVSIGDTWETSR